LTNNVLSEQRLEQRLPALNSAVKIRRRGLGFNPWRYDLNLIDLSANGMALLSPGFKLSLLQKIDFELSSGGLSTSGCAVVCNAGHHSNKQRYGLLFIETDDEFDAFLTGEDLSSVEVMRLGTEIAEQYMYQRVSKDDVFFRVQNQRMIDAITTLARRLGQMGLYINNEQGQVVLPEDSIVVVKNGGLSVPLITGGSSDIQRTDINLVYNKNSGSVSYKIADDQLFDNIIGLLNHLCRCFDQISAPQ